MKARKTPVKLLLCRKSNLSADFCRTRTCYRQSGAPDPVENRAERDSGDNPALPDAPVLPGIPDLTHFCGYRGHARSLAGVSQVLMSGPLVEDLHQQTPVLRTFPAISCRKCKYWQECV